MGRVWSTPYCCHHDYRSPLGLIGGLALAAILLLSSGCRKQAAFHRVAYDEPAQAGVPIGPAGAEARFPMAHRDHFAGMDVCADAAGKIVVPTLTPNEVKGRNAWMLWTGGNEAFWDWLARHSYGSIDLLKLIDSRNRDGRFERVGLISEPGMRPSTEEETKLAFGVHYDRPVYDNSNDAPDYDVYGYSSGIIGLRLYHNPEFKGNAVTQWDAARYYSDDRYAKDPATIRPFRVGMSCAFCHVGPTPLNPPENVENPSWNNLSATIGAQYFRSRRVLGNALPDDSLLAHVIDAQLPGTIDTSLIASDNINNANTMNSVFLLKSRLQRARFNPKEVMDQENSIYPGLVPKYDLPFLEGDPRSVPRVLVDGSDSVGAWIALARVYLNIGTHHQQWTTLHNTILGFRQQSPFKLADVESHSVYWHATKMRVPYLIDYFANHTDPMKLVHAPQGSEIGKLKGSGMPDDPAYAAGRKVFAKGCIACHSSVQPGDVPELEEKLALSELIGPSDQRSRWRLDAQDLQRLGRETGKLPEAYQQWALKAVERPEFWKDNYLSIDMRIPVSIVRTNSARAVATNAMHGQIWEDFSSTTYKELASVGPVPFFDPVSGANKSFSPPSGGPGYYRVPSLVSMWATAPYLHNNSLGVFNNEPSVKGRLECYDDAITKLLRPELRLVSHDSGYADHTHDVEGDQLTRDHGLVWRTSQPTWFRLYGHQVPALVVGLSGASDVALKGIAWLPSVVLAAIGIVLLMYRQIGDALDAGARSFPLIGVARRVARVVVYLIGMAVVVALSAIYWRYFPAIRVVERSSQWTTAFIQIQIVFIAFLGLLLSFVPVLRYFPSWINLPKVVRVFGIAFLAGAVVLAMGYGRALRGHGGDVVLGPFPKGMPVNLVANLDPNAPSDRMLDAVESLLDYFRRYDQAHDDNKPLLADFEKTVAPKLMNVSKCPDFVMDKGHDYEFIRQLSDVEKRDLIEFLKTL